MSRKPKFHMHRPQGLAYADTVHTQAFQMAIEVMRQECMRNKEDLIHTFIAEETGSELLLPETIVGRGYFRVYPDGVEEFVWNGNVRLRIHPPAYAEGRITQQFERVAIPTEEEKAALQTAWEQEVNSILQTEAQMTMGDEGLKTFYSAGFTAQQTAAIILNHDPDEPHH